MDRINASIESIRSALAQSRITQKKLHVNNYGTKCLGFKDEGIQFNNNVIIYLIINNYIINYYLIN